MTSRSLMMAAGLVLALGAPAALAQNAAQPQTPDQTNKLTKADVPVDKPFGNLNVNTAMVGETEITNFYDRLTAQEFDDLQNRCGVIVQYENDYDQQAVTWCKLFVGAEQTTPRGQNQGQ